MNFKDTAQAKIRVFTDLFAWKEGHKLVVMIHSVIQKFPGTEKYELTPQIRSAVQSITSNIAEGFSRRSYAEKAHFYSIALGSLTEVQNQIFIAKDVHYLSEENFQKCHKQSLIVHKLLNGLIKKSKSIHNS